ncbi:matrixin family metalloprotease [Listeria booriae]|uniref:matrixin family metalloprotease n=1 Tax=Listeria booriae TaxID=1552123 RepID=UPI0016245334|nr:matrixin family metalloprotease [Listeria booriae]MBC2100645.1 matrixin family metalloprotease [Listeria booriae]
MKHIKYLPIILITIAFSSFIVLPTIQAEAAAKVSSWDLVDSGKHLDYDGNSKYMSQVKFGAGLWNAYKKGVIRPDSVSVIQDIYCSDVSVNNNTNATTYGTGKLVFNKKNMDRLSANGKKMVASHELGHALRLAHNTSSDIMCEYNTTRITLSANDKASYNAAYKKY